MFVLLVLLSLTALAQTATLNAPWLLVYDPEGRPRWEIRMENLVRTKDGWEGENVHITLFFEGKPTIKVQAPRLSADPLGRRWSLSGTLSGEGQGFTFTAREAHWTDVLVLLGFSAEGENMEMSADEAHWELSGILELFSAEVKSLGWILRFPYGKYADGLLVAQGVEGEGHDLKIRAEHLELYLAEGRAKFLGVQVVRGS
ncbi:MAG: hypothetical protein ACPLRP_06305 [Candidatus Bipolaricaulaceae bacterium]